MATFDDDDRRYLDALFLPVRENLLRHERVLFGNGQPGVVGQVAEARAVTRVVTEEVVATHAAACPLRPRAPSGAERWGGIGTAIGAVVIAVLGYLGVKPGQ